MDRLSKKIRSKIMASIRSKNTKPEIAVRKTLHRLGYRFRIHNKAMPGNPDITLAKYKTVIFVHGCFWHHHAKCRHGRIPESNRSYWEPKILRTIARDRRARRELKKLGFRVIVLWECQLNNVASLEWKLGKIG